MTDLPDSPRHVVIAGGGIAALEAMMALKDLAGDRVSVTLIAPERDFVLKPLRTAEPFSVDHVRRHPLADITTHFGARLHRDAVRRVSPGSRTVLTDGGHEHEYDALVVAAGARPRVALEHALTFGLEPTPDALSGVVADLEEGYSHSLAFVVPPGTSWALPVYELALMTARQVRSMDARDARLTIVTPEPAPLAIFGPQASDAVRGLLDEAGIDFVGGAYPSVERGGRITMVPGHEELRVDRVVTLPVLEGPHLPGVPADEHGFIPVDEHCRVRGVDDVYAAGDVTDFAVKQGGIGCQQADAVAEQLAAAAGAPLTPRPFRPVLRGKLLTGAGVHYLRSDLRGGGGESEASDLKLWFPPAKVAGRYLGEWLMWYEGSQAHRPPAGHKLDVEVALPASLRTGDDPLALDPLGPLPGRR